MKIGVKTYSNKDYLKSFEDKVDFFEVMTLEKNNYDFLKEFKIPIVIHSQHRIFGINIADKEKTQINLNSINFSRKIADSCNSKKIILHPGDLENKNCSKENMMEFLKNVEDKRIIIENVLTEGKVKRLGTTPDEIKEIIIETKKGFCFDINHALATAVLLKVDYLDFIREFIKLNPIHYHFGGQRITNPSLPFDEKEHLRLSDSDFDLKEVIKLIPRKAEITLETTTDLKKTEDDVRIMKEIMKELKK